MAVQIEISEVVSAIKLAMRITRRLERDWHFMEPGHSFGTIIPMKWSHLDKSYTDLMTFTDGEHTIKVDLTNRVVQVERFDGSKTSTMCVDSTWRVAASIWRMFEEQFDLEPMAA